MLMNNSKFIYRMRFIFSHSLNYSVGLRDVPDTDFIVFFWQYPQKHSETVNQIGVTFVHKVAFSLALIPLKSDMDPDFILFYIIYIYWVFILSAISPHTTSSQVTDIPPTERKRFKGDHLSTSLWFFNLTLQIGQW